jgi:hypothetical protein
MTIANVAAGEDDLGDVAVTMREHPQPVTTAKNVK